MTGAPFRDQVPKAHRGDPPGGTIVSIILVAALAVAVGMLLARAWVDDPMPCKPTEVYVWVEYPTKAECVDQQGEGA